MNCRSGSQGPAMRQTQSCRITRRSGFLMSTEVLVALGMLMVAGGVLVTTAIASSQAQQTLRDRQLALSALTSILQEVNHWPGDDVSAEALAQANWQPLLPDRLQEAVLEFTVTEIELPAPGQRVQAVLAWNRRLRSSTEPRAARLDCRLETVMWRSPPSAPQGGELP